MIRRIRPEALIALVTLAVAACWWPSWMSDHPLRMRFPFDDTYITFRYAANLAHGLGIVWNSGGPHTEGYTNFLLVLLLVPFSAFGWDLVIVSQIIGVIAVALSALAIYRIVLSAVSGVQSWDPDSRFPIPAVLATGLFLLNPFTWFNAYSGMETSLFTMWLLLSVWAFASERTELAFAFATLSALTRPEGALMGMLLLAVGWLRLPREEVKDSPTIFAYWIAAFVIPLAIYAGWKLWYFGNLLPNSFYVKVEPSNVQSIFPGFGVLKDFIGGSWYLLPLGIIAFWRFNLREVSSRIAVIAALWCMLLGLFYLFSHLLMGSYDRFTNSMEAMLIVLAAIGFARMMPKERIVLERIAAVSLVLFQIGWMLFLHQGIGDLTRDISYEDTYRQIAPVFRSIPGHQYVSFAWADAGILPYYTQMYNIDLVGLNTNEIAHAHNASQVIQYVLHARPDIIIIPLRMDTTSDTCRTIFRDGHGLIGTAYPELTKQALAIGYQPVAEIPLVVYDLNILVDTRSPEYGAITSTLRAHFAKPAWCVR